MKRVHLAKQSLHLRVYALVPLIAIIACHYITYDLGMRVGALFPGRSLATPLDNAWPFVPAWMIIYIAAYFFCLINDILASYGTRRHFYSFCTAYILIHLIAMLFFCFMPVFVERPDVSANDFLTRLVRMMYESDLSGNCFPSLHCGLAILAWLGVRKVKLIGRGYQIFSLIFAILICLSTLFTREHFIVDAVAGVGLALFLFWASKRFGWYKPVMRFFDWVNQVIWGVVVQD